MIRSNFEAAVDHGVLGRDLGEEGRQKPKEAVWHDDAPRGKLDLLVTIDFRMSTTAVYSDIVLPTASWYEKNDLNTSDMHPFIHPLQAAVDPAYESKSDWEIFKAIAKKFQEVAPEILGKETDIVALPRAILAGEIAHAAGRTDEAVAILRAGIEVEDGLVYSEPRAWHMPVRHTLGAILVEAGRVAEAEEVYHDALEDLPRQGWAQFGLIQALEAQDKTVQAQDAKRMLQEYWARADVWLRSSRF